MTANVKVLKKGQSPHDLCLNGVNYYFHARACGEHHIHLSYTRREKLGEFVKVYGVQLPPGASPDTEGTEIVVSAEVSLNWFQKLIGYSLERESRRAIARLKKHVRRRHRLSQVAKSLVAPV